MARPGNLPVRLKAGPNQPVKCNFALANRRDSTVYAAHRRKHSQLCGAIR